MIIIYKIPLAKKRQVANLVPRVSPPPTPTSLKKSDGTGSSRVTQNFGDDKQIVFSSLAVGCGERKTPKVNEVDKSRD